MDLGLADHVYLVTGGSRGLGRSAAAQLVSEGARVVISARDVAGAEAAANELGKDNAVGVPADNRDADAATRLVAVAIARFGRLDGALVSVGGPPTGTVLGSTDDDWRQSFETIFLGGLRIARATAQSIKGPGAIGFVLSTSVRAPIPNLAISNGLRAGLAMTAKTLADELGPRGIRVFGLLPGRIATDRLAQLDGAASDPSTARKRAEQAIPLRRYGEPAEFGRVAAFMLSPAASYVTGAMIPVDGGLIRAL